jgi:hypothetical protein
MQVSADSSSQLHTTWDARRQKELIAQSIEDRDMHCFVISTGCVSSPTTLSRWGLSWNVFLNKVQDVGCCQQK